MRRILAALLCGVLPVVAGCGGDGGDDGRLTVSAAASLRDALTEYGTGFAGAEVRTSFAGSDELAAQIRRGVRPDVYAAANTELPDALHREGLVEEPRVFASNRLVVAVPPGSEIDSIADLAEPGTKLALGARTVPVGRYARSVIGRLEPETAEAIRSNVRAEEPDVKGVVAKVAQGAVDAGLVYVTDVTASDGRTRAVDLPAALQPTVHYGVAVVRGARNPPAARRFVDGLLGGEGARILADAGFEPPR